jgi:hypothetical protein
VIRVPFLIFLWEISRRDATRPFVNSSLGVAEDSHTLQEIQKLGSGDDERIDDQGFDRGLGQNLWHADIGIAARGDIDKNHICGILGASGADVQFTDCLNCHSSEQKPVRNLNSG